MLDLLRVSWVFAVLVCAAPRAHADPLPELAMLTTQPVAGGESSGFGWRDDPIRHRDRFHGGTDFRADPGTPVLAAGDGTVIFTGYLGGYGYVIFVDHGGGVVTRYAHLRKIETKKGATVAAGDRIGQVGATGRVTGPHLHFEVRIDGRAVDPNAAMSVGAIAREAPVLGYLALVSLAPEVQAEAASGKDPPRHQHGPRPQILW